MHNKLVIEFASENIIQDIEYINNKTKCYNCYNVSSNNIVIDLKGFMTSQLRNLSRILHHCRDDIARLTFNNSDSYKLSKLTKIIKELINNKNNVVISFNDENYADDIDQLTLNIKNKEIQIDVDRLKVSISSVKYIKYMKLFEIEKDNIFYVHCDDISNIKCIIISGYCAHGSDQIIDFCKQLGSLIVVSFVNSLISQNSLKYIKKSLSDVFIMNLEDTYTISQFEKYLNILDVYW